jgi:alpha-beta hydrolase superfamily lysophospholipase
MRLGPGLSALFLVLALAGCGGGKSDEPNHSTSEGPLGKGPSGVWLYKPAGKPKNLVIYLHGQGGPTEATPENHLPWIEHLVSRGNVVVYPRYEMDYEKDPLKFVVQGLRTATGKVDVKGLPVLVIGYSRGGGMAVEYGAVAAQTHVPVPDAIMSVFPSGSGNWSYLLDLSGLDHSTPLVFLVGDKDTVVGRDGVSVLAKRLQAAAFPAENIQLIPVASHGSFKATHTAPLETSKAAQNAFWQPADEILTDLDAR